MYVCVYGGSVFYGWVVVFFVSRLAWLLLGGRVDGGWSGVVCWVGGLLCGLLLAGLMGGGLQSSHGYVYIYIHTCMYICTYIYMCA